MADLPPIIESFESAAADFKMPRLETLNDANNALAMIIEAVSTGELLPGQGESLSAIVSSFLKSLEIAELETRLAALEAKEAPAATAQPYNA
jgi:uncharacterized protein YccT (UPF0319 family)